MGYELHSMAPDRKNIKLEIGRHWAHMTQGIVSLKGWGCHKTFVIEIGSGLYLHTVRLCSLANFCLTRSMHKNKNSSDQLTRLSLVFYNVVVTIWAIKSSSLSLLPPPLHLHANWKSLLRLTFHRQCCDVFSRSNYNSSRTSIHHCPIDAISVANGAFRNEAFG